MARYCRQCGEHISFGKSDAQPVNDRLPSEEKSRSYQLNAQGLTDVLALKCHKGFLIVVGDRGILIFDVHKLHEPLLGFTAPEGRAVRGVTILTTTEDEQLLITTSRGVYRIHLATLKVDSAPVWELKTAGRYIAHPVVDCGGQLYLLEINERNQSSRLVCLPDAEVITFDGMSRPPLRINEKQFFFFTQDQVFLHDGTDQSTRQKPFPEHLADKEAAYSQRVEAFYLVGEGGLWRLSLVGGELTPVNLPTRILSGAQLSAREDRIFVAHSQGFIILDPVGNTRWDSNDLFIRAASDGLSPQLTDDYVLFTALGQNGGTDLRIHELKNLKNFKTFTYNERLLCQPLLIHGRLLVATGATKNLQLNCAT
jgi:hypothetical protein